MKLRRIGPKDADGPATVHVEYDAKRNDLSIVVSPLAQEAGEEYENAWRKVLDGDRELWDAMAGSAGGSWMEHSACRDADVDALKRVLSRALPQVDLVRSQIVRYMRMLGMAVPGGKEAAK